MISVHTSLRLAVVSLGAIALASCSSSGSSNPSPPPPPAPPVGSSFNSIPVGQLIAGSGTGYADNTVYRSNLRFPLLKAHAYANSQVYRPGGSQHATPGQCNASNYDYPWQDNFCETRTTATNIWCPSGKGHQGQDIRGASCKKSSDLDAMGDTDTNVVVAAEAGHVIAKYPHYIKVQSDDETSYINYLHMDQITVSLGDRVTRGQRLGRVANIGPSGQPYTTRHLHFELKQVMDLGGGPQEVHVNPYASLIKAYERLLSVTP